MNVKTQNYLSFRVGTEWYAIDVTAVIEVFRFMALSELPAASPETLGLMTVRDMVMPVLDLRLLFGLAEAPLSLDTPVIALHTEAGPLGLVVDDTDNVEPLTENQLMAYEGGDSPYVTAVARLAGRLLLLLDIAKIRRNTQLPATAMPV